MAQQSEKVTSNWSVCMMNRCKSWKKRAKRHVTLFEQGKTSAHLAFGLTLTRREGSICSCQAISGGTLSEHCSPTSARLLQVRKRTGINVSCHWKPVTATHQLFFFSVEPRLLVAIPNLYVVETVDSAKKASTLDKACASRSEPLRIFLQVNTSAEECKFGLPIKAWSTLGSFFLTRWVRFLFQLM